MPGEAAVERQDPLSASSMVSRARHWPTLGDASGPLAASACSCLCDEPAEGIPMPDDGRADAPNETGFGNLDEATLRALIEHVPVTVYIDRLDETGSNVYTSPRLESELGYTTQEWISDRELYAKVLHPEDRERILAEYRRTRDTDEPFRAEYRMIARDGTVHCSSTRRRSSVTRLAGPPTSTASCSTSLNRGSWRRPSAAARSSSASSGSTSSHSRSTRQPSSRSTATGSSSVEPGCRGALRLLEGRGDRAQPRRPGRRTRPAPPGRELRRGPPSGTFPHRHSTSPQGRHACRRRADRRAGDRGERRHRVSRHLPRHQRVAAPEAVLPVAARRPVPPRSSRSTPTTR